MEALGGEPAEAQDDGLAVAAVHDRRLDADAARAAVEDDVDVTVEVGADVRGRRRAHPPEAVGRRCGNAVPERPQEALRERLVGDTQPDGVGAARHLVEDLGTAAQHERERARPAALGEGARRRRELRAPPSDRGVDGGPRGQVHDHGMVRRARLDLVQAPQRRGVARVRAQAVDRLGREGHEAAPPQRPDRVVDAVPRRAHQ